MSELKESAPAHRVHVSMGFTRNLGGFESMRMDISLGIDNKPGETPDQTFDRVAGWVEKRFLEKFAEVEAEISGK